jgi:uncharacterized SAM-binding protein YcdF (DUF218 family)
VLPLVQFSKLFIPGSWSFFLVVATVAVVLLFQRRPRGRTIARAMLAILVGCYWIASLPVVADAIQSGYPPVPTMSSDAFNDNDTVVVLGAGLQTYRIGEEEIAVPTAQSALNVLDGAALFRRMRSPWVIVTGGIADAGRQRAREADVLAVLLEEHGVPADRIVKELASNTTHTQAINVAALAKSRGFGRLIIVTSPAHLRRAVPSFRAQGVAAEGYPARYASDRRVPASRWLPSIEAHDITQDALYDYAGWLYYRSRGWLSGASH